MNLPEIRNALCTAVKAGTTLKRADPYLYDQANPPMFAVGDATLSYHQTMVATGLIRFTCWLVVSKANDRASQVELDGWLTEDAGGVLAAVEADQTLGGTASAVVVRDAKTVLTTIGGTQFYGAQFTVEVYA